ncbi:unnamed protein product, partial [Ilex paraguariensis]
DENIAQGVESLPPDHGGDSSVMGSFKKHASKFSGTLGSARKQLGSDLSRLSTH